MSALEAVVNAWMESDHPRIRHVCQNMRGEHILLSFVYEEARELEQRVSAQAQATNAMPSLRTADNISSSGSRLQSEYSVCKAAIG